MNLPAAAHFANVWPFTNGAVDQSKLGPLLLDRDGLARTRAGQHVAGRGHCVLSKLICQIP